MSTYTGANAVVYHPPPSTGVSELDEKYANKAYILRVSNLPPNGEYLKALSRIDPSQEYFIYPVKCSSFKLEGKEVSGCYEIYGGITIHNYLYSSDPDSDIEDKLPPITFEMYAKICERLILGLDLLHRSGFSHGDIASNGVNAANVVIDEKGNPRYIDLEYMRPSSYGDDSQLTDQGQLLGLLIDGMRYVTESKELLDYKATLEERLKYIDGQLNPPSEND